MTEKNEGPRAVGFEVFKREHPHVKKLASAWRGSEEFNSWMELYTKDDNTTIEYLEEDDHQIGTFYRKLSEAEIEKLGEAVNENQEVVPAGPQHYEILKVVHEHADEKISHKVTHVKLGTPRWVRVGKRYGLVEYVMVDQYRETVDDENGTFTDIVTTVAVTDENQSPYEEASPIYVAPSFLEVFEVMFAIGEIGEYNEVQG